MKKLLPQLVLLFLLLLPLFGRAQEVWICGRVVDGDTQEPIAFPSVKLREAKTTVLGDEYGFFQIASPQLGKPDSVIIMTLGYTRSAIQVGQNKEQILLVKLCRPYQLLEPPTGAMKLDFEMGIYNKSSLKPEMLWSNPGSQYAFLFRNEYKKKFKKINSVSFYVGGNGLPREDFRVNIYTVDQGNKLPYHKLFTSKDIYPLQNGEWCTLDLRNASVAVPEDEYFVSIEFVVTEGFGSNNQNYLYDYVPSGKIMRPDFGPDNNSIWSYINGVWKELPVGNNGYYEYKTMIRVEVE